MLHEYLTSTFVSCYIPQLESGGIAMRNRDLIRGDASDQLCEDNGVSSKSSRIRLVLFARLIPHKIGTGWSILYLLRCALLIFVGRCMISVRWVKHFDRREGIFRRTGPRLKN